MGNHDAVAVITMLPIFIFFSILAYWGCKELSDKTNL